MLENKVVSVIVPVYNCENVIGRCIKSIQLQTYASLEIILVDDGALDDSGKICDEFAGQDVRIRVIHKKNGGVSSARNQGINTATGSFVMFVDSDDYLEKDYIEKMMMAQQQNDAELVIGGYTFTDDQEKSGHFCAPMYFENKEQFLDKFDILYKKHVDKLIEEEMVQEINYDNIPNYSQIMDSFKHPEYDPEDKYSVPYLWGTFGIIYNTKVVDKEDVKSWDVFWNPKYDKKIQILTRALKNKLKTLTI